MRRGWTSSICIGPSNAWPQSVRPSTPARSDPARPAGRRTAPSRRRRGTSPCRRARSRCGPCPRSRLPSGPSPVTALNRPQAGPLVHRRRIGRRSACLQQFRPPVRPRRRPSARRHPPRRPGSRGIRAGPTSRPPRGTRRSSRIDRAGSAPPVEDRPPAILASQSRQNASTDAAIRSARPLGRCRPRYPSSSLREMTSGRASTVGSSSSLGFVKMTFGAMWSRTNRSSRSRPRSLRYSTTASRLSRWSASRSRAGPPRRSVGSDASRRPRAPAGPTSSWPRSGG